MKPTFITSTLLAIVCFTLSIISGFSQNYVQNSSFEDDLGTANWGFSLFGGASSSATIDTAQYHWESRSLKLDFTGSSTPQSGIYSTLKQAVSNLTSGKTYYVYAWCKGQAVGSGNTLSSGGTTSTSTAIPSGTYGWQLLEQSFVASGSTASITITVKTQTTALWVDDVYLTEYQRKDVSGLGITGNDTDVTAAIASNLTAYKFLYFPAGTYRVSNSITIPTGAILWGDGATSVFNNVGTASALFTASGNDTTFVGNNEITGISFRGVSTTSLPIAVSYRTAKNILVRHCSADKMRLFYISTHKANYSDITSESMLSSNVSVAFNSVVGYNAGAGVAYPEGNGISLRYVVDSEIYKNDVRYIGGGILWWGGNAAFGTSSNQNGDINNPRWVRRIWVAGNTVEHVNGGGIYGCMGQYITVEGNTINDAGDVGLDLEGCFDSVAKNNTVTDGVNGALSTFYATVNVTFSNNLVTSTIPTNPLYRMYNSSMDVSNVVNLTLDRNTFQCTSGIAPVDDYKGSGHITITNNTFSNVVIDISRRSIGNRVAAPIITGNTMTYTYNTTDPWAAINIFCDTENGTISNNKIYWNGTGQSTKTGIKYRKSEYITGPLAQTVTIEKNYIRGCTAAGIDVYWASPTLTANINSNQVGSNIVVGAQGQLIVNATGNKNLSGGDKPLTWVP